jgi:hypothetical protein
MDATENAREAVRLAFNQARGFTFARSKGGAAFHVMTPDSAFVLGAGACSIPKSREAAVALANAAEVLL